MNTVKKLVQELMGYGIQVTPDTLWCYFPYVSCARNACEALRSSGYNVWRVGCSVRVES